MGKKYIIELPENTHWVQWILESTKDQYQVCHLDFKRVEDLTPYTEPDIEQVRKEGYQQGLSDAKEGKATCQYCEYEYLDDTEEPCKKCCNAYMNKYKPKAKEEQIQVGDEVTMVLGKAVVTGVGPVHFEYVYADGSHGYDEVKNVKKTGRHFPEVAAVLEKMRESE